MTTTDPPVAYLPTVAALAEVERRVRAALWDAQERDSNAQARARDAYADGNIEEAAAAERDALQASGARVALGRLLGDIKAMRDAQERAAGTIHGFEKCQREERFTCTACGRAVCWCKGCTGGEGEPTAAENWCDDCWARWDAASETREGPKVRRLTEERDAARESLGAACTSLAEAHKAIDVAREEREALRKHVATLQKREHENQPAVDMLAALRRFLNLEPDASADYVYHVIDEAYDSLSVARDFRSCAAAIAGVSNDDRDMVILAALARRGT